MNFLTKVFKIINLSLWRAVYLLFLGMFFLGLLGVLT